MSLGNVQSERLMRNIVMSGKTPISPKFSRNFVLTFGKEKSERLTTRNVRGDKLICY